MRRSSAQLDRSGAWWAGLANFLVNIVTTFRRSVKNLPLKKLGCLGSLNPLFPDKSLSILKYLLEKHFIEQNSTLLCQMILMFCSVSLDIWASRSGICGSMESV